MSDNDVLAPAIIPKSNGGIKTYGKRIHRSRLCPICTHRDIKEINLMRARDHMSLDEIHTIKNVSISALRTHFNNHFIINKTNRDIIAVKEDGSSEASEIIETIFEGDVDIFAGAQGVLESKAQRLNPILNRLKKLTTELEVNGLEDFETQEYMALNKLAEDIENSMFKTFQVVDKRLLPFKREEISNAILSYKLKILKKMLDRIQLVLVEYEKKPEYNNLIRDLRATLAEHFNKIEDEILQSGGTIVNPYETSVSDTNTFLKDARDLELAKKDISIDEDE